MLLPEAPQTITATVKAWGEWGAFGIAPNFMSCGACLEIRRRDLKPQIYIPPKVHESILAQYLQNRISIDKSILIVVSTILVISIKLKHRRENISS